MLLGRMRALNERCNMVLEDVTKMWVRVPETKVKEQTLQVDDGKTTATHKKLEPEETHMPSYLDLDNRSDDGIAESSVSLSTFQVLRAKVHMGDRGVAAGHGD